MSKISDFMQVNTRLGDRVTIGDVAVTPQSQAVIVRWRPNAAFVYNRPLAVMVERNGESRRIPVVDVTRLIQIGLLVLSLVFLLAARSRQDVRRDINVRSDE